MQTHRTIHATPGEVCNFHNEKPTLSPERHWSPREAGDWLVSPQVWPALWAPRRGRGHQGAAVSSGILALALQYTQRALGLPLLLVTLGTGRVTWVREEHGFSGPTKLEHLNRSPRSDPHPHKGLRRGGLWGQPGDTEKRPLCASGESCP